MSDLLWCAQAVGARAHPLAINTTAKANISQNVIRTPEDSDSKMKRRPVCKLDASQGQGRGHPLATPVNQSTESNGSNLALPHSNGRVERTNKEGSLNQGLKMAFHNPNDGKKQMMFFILDNPVADIHVTIDDGVGTPHVHTQTLFT